MRWPTSGLLEAERDLGEARLELARTEDTVVSLSALIDRAIGLHQPIEGPALIFTICGHCHRAWPCPTVSALGGP